MKSFFSVLIYLPLVFSSLVSAAGIINVQTAVQPQKISTLNLIEQKEIELNQIIDELKAKLELRKQVTRERYRLVAGIKILSRKTLIEKMKAYEELKKIKEILQLELNLREIENLGK